MLALAPPPVLDAHALVIAGALLLFAIALRQLLGGRETTRGDEDLELALVERGVSERDRCELSLWARTASPEEASALLRDRGAFDRFVRDRLQSLGRSALSEAERERERLELLPRLAALRIRLGHARVEGARPQGSRDVAPGTRVALRPDALPGAAERPGPRVEVAVESVDEEAVVVVAPALDPAALTPGRGAWASFDPGGAGAYRFRTRVLARPGLAPGTAALAHGDFLLFEERRRDLRVAHRATVGATVLGGPELAAARLEGKTVDLSRGGVALVLAPAGTVGRGARLALSIELEPGRAPLSVVARVVSVGAAEAAGRPSSFLHCQIVETSPEARARLSSYLAAARGAPVGSR